MPEEIIPPADDTRDEPTESTAETAKKKSPAPVPYERFSQVVQQRNDLETKLEAANNAVTNANTEKLAAITKATEAEARVAAMQSENEAKALESLALVEKYKVALSGIVDDITKELSDEAKELDPGAEADPVDRLKWATSMKALLEKMTKGHGLPGASPKPQAQPPVSTASTVIPTVNVKRTF